MARSFKSGGIYKQLLAPEDVSLNLFKGPWQVLLGPDRMVTLSVQTYLGQRYVMKSRVQDGFKGHYPWELLEFFRAPAPAVIIKHYFGDVIYQDLVMSLQEFALVANRSISEQIDIERGD